MVWDNIGKNIVKKLNISTTLDKFIHMLVDMTEMRDSYTIGHAKRVAQYSYMLALDNGENAKFLRDIYLAGLLHDIGKVGIPDVILLKPMKLTEDEYELIKMHSTLSAKMLEHIDEFEDILPAIKHHHEHYDGSGYPDGLKGEAIPKMARYLIIADVFDALSSTRIYRKALSVKESLEIMKKESQRYDPKILSLFLERAQEYYSFSDKSHKILYPKLENYRNDFFFRDHLTYTFNREALLYFIKKGAEKGFPIYLGGFNIKHFSLYNKEYGTSEGDKLLINITRVLFKELDVFNYFGEIVENKFYLFRAYADHFYVLYFGDRYEFLNIKLKKVAEKISDMFSIEFQFFKLISKKADPDKIIREVDFLL